MADNKPATKPDQGGVPVEEPTTPIPGQDPPVTVPGPQDAQASDTPVEQAKQDVEGEDKPADPKDGVNSTDDV